MLTKNFYSYMRATLQKTSVEFTKTDGNTSTANINGDSPPFNVMVYWSKALNKIGVSFGTGTTPSTVSDYFLESILGDTQISVTVPSAVTFSRVDTFDEYSVSFGVTNITDEAITISEVGLIANPLYGGSPTSSSNVYTLVDRTVLDAPVTIPAGQSKQIAYTIRFNY